MRSNALYRLQEAIHTRCVLLNRKISCAFSESKLSCETTLNENFFFFSPAILESQLYFRNKTKQKIFSVWTLFYRVNGVKERRIVCTVGWKAHVPFEKTFAVAWFGSTRLVRFSSFLSTHFCTIHSVYTFTRFCCNLFLITLIER